MQVTQDGNHVVVSETGYVINIYYTYIIYTHTYIHIYHIYAGDTGRQLCAGVGDGQDPCI